MSAKFLYSLKDENPELQKQIGCMNGILQLFDRHHFLAGRRINSHGRKRLPPGQSGNHVSEANSSSQKAKEKNLKKVIKEKQRISTESPRTSFSSSSCPSSFSSLDCNRKAHLETSSFSPTIFPETHSRDLPMNQPNASLHINRQCPDLRNVVKDSIYREARGLSVKTTTKEETTSHTMKHRDSPRPMQLPKSVKPRVSGLNESFTVLAKLREAPWNSREEKDFLEPKDAPRLSYDGRESRDTFKSTIKLKELPRLSLDSRAGSIRGSASEIKSNNLLGVLHRRNGKSDKILNPQQEPENYKRSSGVVAKLMGLDAFPDSMLINENPITPMKICSDDDYDPFSRSSRTTDETKQTRISGSPRNSKKEAISPRLKNPDSVMKPTLSSRFPIEPAPGRQRDGTRGSQIPALKCRESLTKTSNSSPSVYGEIEKRLAELEFKKSGKDLRALKQILEAMQKTEGMLETKKAVQASTFVSHTSNNSSPDQGLKLANLRNIQGNCPNSATSSPKSSKLPIVIMKPTKLIEKASNLTSSAILTDALSGLHRLLTDDAANSRKESIDKRSTKDLTPTSNHLRNPSGRPLSSMDINTSARALKLTKTSKVPQHITGEITTSSTIGSGTVSPRLQQKKLELEKRSHPGTISSNLSRTRRQPSRRPTESGSTGRRLVPKSPHLQQSSDQLHEISSSITDLSHQGDDVSLQSESNISLASQSDTDVTSNDQSNKTNGTFLQQDGQDKKNPAAILSEDGSMASPAISTSEQPSPISVLDATFCSEDLPSPVKKISNAFQDDDSLNSNEVEWNLVDLNHLSNRTKPNLSFENDQKRLETIQHLVQNVGQTNFNNKECINSYITPLCKNTNPDHRYILEILLASGLLKDLKSGLTTLKLHSSGLPINPNLFLAMEQIKANTGFSNDEHMSEKVDESKPNEKIPRKLLFDAVNEILVRKLVLEGSSKHWFSPNKLATRRSGGQQLLKELCLEIDELQPNNSDCSLDDEDNKLRSIFWEDLMHRSMTWTEFHSEISRVVLDVERLIFKDLINEVVSGAVAGQQARPSGHRRQLFSK